MKKTIIILAIMLGVIVALLSIIPLFIDINKHVKPLLVSAVEENTEFKIDLSDLKLTLYQGVRLSTDAVKITKEDLEIVVSKVEIIAPYSALLRSPQKLMDSLKVGLRASKISINNKLLIIEGFGSDLVKTKDHIRIDNGRFRAFDGQGYATAVTNLSGDVTTNLEFEVRNGRWPVQKLKDELIEKVKDIPRAEKLVRDFHIDDRFESLKGKIVTSDETIRVESINLNIPANEIAVNGSGTIVKKQLKMTAQLLIPLNNIPSDLKASDGRAKIPLDIAGTTADPKVIWDRAIDLVVRAYTKDEGKEILKKEVKRLKEKLLKDEKVKDFIEGLKF